MVCGRIATFTEIFSHLINAARGTGFGCRIITRDKNDRRLANVYVKTRWIVIVSGLRQFDRGHQHAPNCTYRRSCDRRGSS
jgi:hypothetical protein